MLMVTRADQDKIPKGSRPCKLSSKVTDSHVRSMAVNLFWVLLLGMFADKWQKLKLGVLKEWTSKQQSVGKLKWFISRFLMVNFHYFIHREILLRELRTNIIAFTRMGGTYSNEWPQWCFRISFSYASTAEVLESWHHWTYGGWIHAVKSLQSTQLVPCFWEK